MRKSGVVVAMIIGLNVLPQTTKAAEKSSQVAGWRIDRIDDDFSDKQKVVVTKVTDDSVIGFRCIDGKASVAVVPGKTLTVGDFFTLKARLDKGEIMEGMASPLDEHILEIGILDDDFYTKAAAAKSLALRIETKTTWLDLKYSLAGFDRASKPFLEACKLGSK